MAIDFDEEKHASPLEEAQWTREEIAGKLDEILIELRSDKSASILNGLVPEIHKIGTNISVLTTIAVMWSLFVILRAIF